MIPDKCADCGDKIHALFVVVKDKRKRKVVCLRCARDYPSKKAARPATKQRQPQI